MRLSLAALLMVAGCHTERADLVVDMITDLVPGVDFVGTRSRIVGSDRASQSSFAWLEDVEGGFRVARFESLELGPTEVELEVLGLAGEVVFKRSILVDLDASKGVTIVVARSCLGVICEAGLACVGGECADASCTVENNELCFGLEGPACEVADDCQPNALCGGRCESGVCLSDVRSACPEDEWCHPEQGCVPRVAQTEARIVLEADGNGRVHSEHGDCGPSASCELLVPVDTLLTVEAEPLDDSEFWGWVPSQSIGCGDREPCAFRVYYPLTLRAYFAPSRYDVSSLPATIDGEGVQVVLRGLAFGPDGAVYAADHANDTIWRVGADGELERFAGSGVAGVDEEPVPALEAHFSDPSGLAFTADGDLFVADSSNNLIRVVRDGMVSVFAGTGENSSTDGVLAQASFNSPSAVSWSDALGWLLVGDADDLRIIREGVVESVHAPRFAAAAILDDDGTIYWGASDGIMAMRIGGEASLEFPSPCGRGSSYAFRVAWGASGSILESVPGGYHCQVLPSGENRQLFLRGGRLDGPDYIARSYEGGWAIAGSASGEIAFVDDWPGELLRVLLPH